MLRKGNSNNCWCSDVSIHDDDNDDNSDGGGDVDDKRSRSISLVLRRALPNSPVVSTPHPLSSL